MFTAAQFVFSDTSTVVEVGLLLMNGCIAESKLTCYFNVLQGDYISRRPYFPLNHSIGNLIPSAVMLKPDLEKSKCFGQSARAPVHHERIVSGRDFITTPTIPKSHMPHSALKRQASRGWSDAHYTREITVNTARDSMKYNQWNDISA